MQFSAALDHYKAAVRVDSSFALAALRGAQSADWLSSSDQDSALVEVALSHEPSLPLLQRMIARGLRAYVIGNADSAVYYFDTRFDDRAGVVADLDDARRGVRENAAVARPR